jgi:hypothetical protein
MLVWAVAMQCGRLRPTRRLDIRSKVGLEREMLLREEETKPYIIEFQSQLNIWVLNSHETNEMSEFCCLISLVASNLMWASIIYSAFNYCLKVTLPLKTNMTFHRDPEGREQRSLYSI